MATQTPSNNIAESDLELLSAYIDNQLGVAERVALERRLEREAALRDELAELQATSALLRELPPLAIPRSFAIDPARAPQRGWSFPSRWTLQLGGGLAGLALVALFSLQFLFSTGTSNTAMAPASVPAATMEAAIAMAPAPTTAPAPAAAMEAAPAVTVAPAAGAAALSAAPTEAPAAALEPDPDSATAAREAGDASGTGPAEATAPDAVAQESLTLATASAPTEVIGNTDSSSPGTTQLQPADPAANQAAKQPPADQGGWTGLLVGGFGLLVLAVIVVVVVRGRGV